MATNQIFRYPLDKTGTNPDNRVVGEQHTLPNRPIRAVAPNYGLYFTESLVIKDRNTNQPLTSTQFRCVEFQEVPAARFAKEICSVILITDPSVSNNIEITYQVLGGEWSFNSQALINRLNSLDLDNRPVSWPNILNRPDEYNPAPHFHDVGDTYGWEYVVHALNRLRQAILIGDEAAHDELRRYIDQAVGNFDTQIAAVQSSVNTHTARTDNPHSTTKAQVSLGNVENYGIATVSEATTNAASISNKYMTPSLVRQAIAMYAPTLDHSHTFASLTSKPTTLLGYGVTAVDVTGQIKTTNEIRAASSANNSFTSIQSNLTTFVAANGVVQGTMSCATSSATVNGGTLQYQAATHAFTGAVTSTGDFSYSASDERLKKNVTKISDARAKVKQLGGYTYDWDLEACAVAGFTPENLTEHGFVAQQVQEVMPEVVVPAAFNENYWTVRYHRVVPLLSAALCEVIDEVEQVRGELVAIKKQIGLS